MLYKELLSKFEKGLNDIRNTSTSVLEEANRAFALCNEILGILKKEVEANGFKSIDFEIHFFKDIKVEPMKYLIYYIEVRSFELQLPKIDVSCQLDFLQKQSDKINSFFNKNTEFLIYMNQEYTHFDSHYFTRKYANHFPLLKSYPYFKDISFNTSHDGIWARIKGLGMYANYLKTRKSNLIDKKLQVGLDKLKWTGSYAAFVELIYGLKAMGYLNHGTCDIKTIIKTLSEVFEIPQGNYSRTYNELKARKGSQVKFFKEAGDKLQQKMDDEDDIA